MAKIEEIEELWTVDSKIDRTILDGESLKIPELHNKYYKIYIREKVIYEKKKTDLDQFLKLKWEYYTGKIEPQDLKLHNWNPNPYTIMKSDLDKYLDADKEIIDKKLDLYIQRVKVDFLEDIIKVINNRSFQIKNVIEYIKFTQGN